MNYSKAVEKSVEKIGNAVKQCMSSERTLQERLLDCYSNFSVLSDGMSLPPNLQKRFNAMIAAWSTEPAIGGEGTVAATIANISDDDARKWFGEIFLLYTEVVELEAKTHQKI